MAVVLNPDPASTIGASEEYKAAWFATYGTTSSTGGDSTPRSKVRTVPVGTTGWALEPDGTLWVEYIP